MARIAALDKDRLNVTDEFDRPGGCRRKLLSRLRLYGKHFQAAAEHEHGDKQFPDAKLHALVSRQTRTLGNRTIQASILLRRQGNSQPICRDDRSLGPTSYCHLAPDPR